MGEAVELFFDESGLTGRNLLDDRQRLFTFAGVRISDTEAGDLIARLKREHRIFGGELKVRIPTIARRHSDLMPRSVPI